MIKIKITKYTHTKLQNTHTLIVKYMLTAFSIRLLRVRYNINFLEFSLYESIDNTILSFLLWI